MTMVGTRPQLDCRVTFDPRRLAVGVARALVVDGQPAARVEGSRPFADDYAELADHPQLEDLLNEILWAGDAVEFDHLRGRGLLRNLALDPQVCANVQQAFRSLWTLITGETASVASAVGLFEVASSTSAAVR